MRGRQLQEWQTQQQAKQQQWEQQQQQLRLNQSASAQNPRSRTNPAMTNPGQNQMAQSGAFQGRSAGVGSERVNTAPNQMVQGSRQTRPTNNFSGESNGLVNLVPNQTAGQNRQTPSAPRSNQQKCAGGDCVGRGVGSSNTIPNSLGRNEFAPINERADNIRGNTSNNSVRGPENMTTNVNRVDSAMRQKAPVNTQTARVSPNASVNRPMYLRTMEVRPEDRVANRNASVNRPMDVRTMPQQQQAGMNRSAQNFDNEMNQGFNFNNQDSMLPTNQQFSQANSSNFSNQSNLSLDDNSSAAGTRRTSSARTSRG